MNYQEKLVEEEEALEQQQKVANEVAENELFDGSGLEADADDNYDVIDVTTVVDSAVEASDAAVIAASQGSLGVKTPINEQSIALATSYLTEEVADAQKVVDGLKGPKMTAVNNLQSKLDAYQNAADAVEGVVVSANKAAVSFAGLNTAENGTPLFTVPGTPVASTGGLLVDFNVTLTLGVDDVPGVGVATNAIAIAYTAATGTIEIVNTTTTTPVTENAFKNAFDGAGQFLASLDKLKNSVESVGKAETAVQTAVGSVLGADGYQLVKFDAADTLVTQGKSQPWSELPWSNTAGVLGAGATETNAAAFPANLAGTGGLALVKDGQLVTAGAVAPAPDFPVANAAVLYDSVATIAATGVPTYAGTPPATSVDSIANTLETGASVTAEATAAGNLSTAKGDLTAFNKAVTEWKELAELQEKLEAEAENVEAAAEAVAEAEELFEDLGVELVKADNGVATGSVYDENSEDQLADLFVFQKGLTEVDNFDGNDILYFGQSPDGSAYNLVVLGKNETITGDVGSVNAFDIFAVQDGANTTLYIEEKVFAGNGSTKADLIEVELVGVTAADLVINDGFLTLA